MLRTTAERLLRLATCPGAGEEERRTAAVLVCNWLAAEHVLDAVPSPATAPPFADPVLAREGNITLFRRNRAKPRMRPAWYINWSVAQAYALAAPSRCESLRTDDHEVAVVRFILRRAALFGAP